jgi:predicted transcriptional regulator
VLTGHKLKVAQEMYSFGQYTVAAIAKTLGVSRASIYRHLTPRRRLIKPSRPQASRLPDLLHANDAPVVHPTTQDFT